jgi:hypothetical protein
MPSDAYASWWLASIVHVLSITSRTPTPRPGSTPPALSPVVIARTALGGGWRSYESKFDGDLLLEELVAIGTLDGSLCFVEGGVFDEDVALA